MVSENPEKSGPEKSQLSRCIEQDFFLALEHLIFGTLDFFEFETWGISIRSCNYQNFCSSGDWLWLREELSSRVGLWANLIPSPSV